MYYEKQKGLRIKSSRFYGIRLPKGIWYAPHINKIIKDIEGHTVQNYISCRSVRAFRRRLKQFPELQGSTLISKYVGYDVISKNLRRQNESN